LIGSSGRILSYPATQTVLPGGSARFDVSAVGEGALSFQWSFDGIPLIDQPPLAGSQTASLVISGATRAQAGLYSVDVFDAGKLIGRAEAALVVRRITRVKPPEICPTDISVWCLAIVTARLCLNPICLDTKFRSPRT